MSEKLIELINKSNIIIIYGNFGFGRNLLLYKFFRNPNLPGNGGKNVWKGKIEEAVNWLQKYSDLDDSCEKVNIFLDVSQEKYEEDNKIKEFIRHLRLARHHSQRLFLSLDKQGNDYDEIQKEIGEVGDLWIRTCGVSSPSLKLQLKITKGEQKFEEKIVVTYLEMRESDKWMANNKNNQP